MSARPDPWPESCYLCGHPASWHTDGSIGTKCTGGVQVITGRPDIPSPCVCLGFHDPTSEQFERRYAKPTLLAWTASNDPAQASLM